MGNHFIASSAGEPFNKIKDLLAEAKDEIVLIVPYIRARSLLKIIPESNVKITIITSWKIKDLWFGSSDLDIYSLTKDMPIRIFLNNRIHLKVFMIDWQKCILGSSNLTGKGMGTISNYNYELNTIQPDIDKETLLYFRRILADSILVNDAIYEEYRQRVQDLPPVQEFKEPTINKISSDTEFLISSLPMSRDVDSLFTLYSTDFSTDDKEAVECAMHDVVLYNVPPNLSKDEFLHHLKQEFFASTFVEDLLRFIDKEGRYFGRVKEWIQSNCADVPVPSRRDLTGNIQVLYKWIVSLSEGKYVVDRPRHSERIHRAK